jgi:ATP-dependent DNA helicase RecG
VTKVLQFCITPRSTAEIMKYLGLSHREHFRSIVLAPLIESGKIALTIPDKPNSSKQMYVAAKSG